MEPPLYNEGLWGLQKRGFFAKTMTGIAVGRGKGMIFESYTFSVSKNATYIADLFTFQTSESPY